MRPSCPPSLFDLPFSALERELAGDGVRTVHARGIFRAIYRGKSVVLPPPVLRWLDAGRFSREMPLVETDLRSADGQTRKFLLRLADGEAIETVIMGYPRRFTACLSTQAGCAMGCVFCATGQAGLRRNLRPGEIVAQILHCQSALRADGHAGLRNIVLMGMGEPLQNYDAVMTALEILSDPRGLGMAPAKISLSTVGVVPGIRRLADEGRACNLAVSLHAATDAQRTALCPVNRRWPLAELMDACRFYSETTGRRIFFEWTLIAGVNDQPADAEALAQLLAGINAHVNLIPLNPTGGFQEAAGHSAAALFQKTLKHAQIPSTVRQWRGLDIAAGCGQLRQTL